MDPPRTSNPVVQPLLTDLYQLTMAYAYWKAGKTADRAVFELSFRRNPFGGEFAVFAGLAEALAYARRFRYSPADLEYARVALPAAVEPAFFDYLGGVSADDVTICAMDEGSVCFARVPLLRVEGPLIVAQLLETTLLTLVNYATLVATNAARHRLAAGPRARLLEFGLRRAQGPDGGLSASRYAYAGGFDATSNVLAGKLYGVPARGTHAHSLVTAFDARDDDDGGGGGAGGKSRTAMVRPARRRGGDEESWGEVGEGPEVDLMALSLKFRKSLEATGSCNDGELKAFVCYAAAFPDNFVALIDTYDVKKSGLINFCAVALSLNELNYKPIGVRIDSGDLAYLSKIIRNCFVQISEKFQIPYFKTLEIIASNDLNEDVILNLNEQGHEIDCFAVGTNLVTCQKQPSLGGVYKLVELNDRPKMKLTQDIGKITIPGRKVAYRLYSSQGDALIDLLQRTSEPEPVVDKKVLCRHPFEESKRAYVIPSRVENLHKVYWDKGSLVRPVPSLEEVRKKVADSLQTLRSDIKRNLNPTPYKVAVSDGLYSYLHRLWMENAPIGELM